MCAIFWTSLHIMLAAEGNLSWTSDLSAILHQVSCNSTFLGCLEECGTTVTGYDHFCTAEPSSTMSSSTLFCRPCDFSSCDFNVSLILRGLESIEGAFLSKMPRIRDCNSSYFGQVSLLKFYLYFSFLKESHNRIHKGNNNIRFFTVYFNYNFTIYFNYYIRLQYSKNRNVGQSNFIE